MRLLGIVNKAKHAGCVIPAHRKFYSRMACTTRPLVMAGPDPAIYRGTALGYDPRHGAATDGRVKPGHDERAGGAGTANILRVGMKWGLLRWLRRTDLIRSSTP